MKIKKYLAENKDKMLEVLTELISYPSVELEKNGDYPFGEPAAKCLQSALNYAEEFGLKTKNIENYIGFGEIGSGQQTIGIVGHLDVVPPGNGWNTDPYTATIINERMYGRGTSDDKGPMVAGLFAFKYFVDNNIPLNKKMRLIFGCNEESGFKCIRKYVEVEGDWDLGFTPDGPFPCCFGEKGIISFNLVGDNKIFKEIKAGVAVNSVPDSFSALVKKEIIDYQILNNNIKETPLISYSITEEDDFYRIVTVGKAAHASVPKLGVNAATYALTAIAEAITIDSPELKEFKTLINTNYLGSDIGIDLVDQYGKLSFNVGIVKLIEDKLVLGVDIRCPFTRKNQEVIDGVTRTFKVFSVEKISSKDGLYQPEDSDFVQLLTNTYNEVTGKDLKPVSMGGGTYARGIKNTLAFGIGTEKNTNIHDANEFIDIQDLMEATEIYIIALEKMLKL